MSTRRNGFRWTINETLALQREYELLGMCIHEIAVRHERTIEAILFRLEKEGFITHQSTARGYNTWVKACLDEVKSYQGEYHQDAQGDDEDDDDMYISETDEASEIDEVSQMDDVSEIDKLSDRVWTLEEGLNDIKDMVTKIFNSLNTTKMTETGHRTSSSSSYSSPYPYPY